MNKSVKSEIDLLENRRLDSGIKSPIEISVITLQRKGLAIGSGVISIGVIGAITIGIYNSNLENKKIKLSRRAEQYDLLKSKFEKEIESISNIYATNNQIANGIIGIRSGSGLLSNIKEITPKKLQITGIDTSKNKLNLIGISPQPIGLDVINSMKLKLENSFFLDPNNVSIIRIWETTKSVNSKQKKYMAFKVKADFTKNQKAKNMIAYMEKLGSYGLAKRISILDKEGLIK